MDAPEQALDKTLYFVSFEGAAVVSVYGVKNGFVNFCELLLVGEDLVEVVDGFSVVHFRFKLQF